MSVGSAYARTPRTLVSTQRLHTHNNLILPSPQSCQCQERTGEEGLGIFLMVANKHCAYTCHTNTLGLQRMCMRMVRTAFATVLKHGHTH